MDDVPFQAIENNLNAEYSQNDIAKISVTFAIYFDAVGLLQKNLFAV